MGFWDDPLSSLWFNLLVTVVPLVLFLALIYILKRKAKAEKEEEETNTGEQVAVF